METLNDRIKDLRKSKGLTQLQLSELLCVTDKAVSKWELGEANPDISLLPRMAEIFGVTLDYLLTGKKDEDKISLDDMDCEKRMHYLIKKDDLEGFLKYGYEGCSRNNSLFTSTIRFGNFNFTMINLDVWKEILTENANKILNKGFDLLLSKNNFDASLAFLVEDIIDELIVKAVDLDRSDVLEAIGIMAAKVGLKEPKPGYRGSSIASRTTFMLPLSLYGNMDEAFRFNPVIIKQETLDYIFENEKKAPKCYSVISKINFKGLSKDERKHERECYFNNVLESDILNCAVKYKKFDLVKAYVDAFAAELASLDRPDHRSGEFYYVRGTYITNNYQVVRRFYSWNKSYIDMMIAANETDIAKAMIKHNRDYAEKYERVFPGKKPEPYIITDDEVDRKAKLQNTKMSESERFMLEVIKDCCIDVGVLRTSRDIKLVKKILSSNALNHYEFIYNCIKNKELKDLFKFFIDHDDASNATSLMVGETNYEEVIRSSFRKYCSIDLCFEVLGIERNQDPRRSYMRVSDDEARRRVSDLLNKADVLNENPIIAKINDRKVKIITDVEEAIATEKKAEEERIEREKVAKGLSRDYFEKLLTDNNKEMFYLKLCSLLDAIFKFDYHYEGEDLSERMNAHFKALEKAAPTSRDCDDGWGYMVLDTEYEREVVEPAKKRIEHLRDIFYRLRVSRNNVAHSEQVKVNELSPAEMKECLEYVFSINKEAE